MANYLRMINIFGSVFRLPPFLYRLSTQFSTTSINHLKEVRETVEEKVTIIEGVYVESSRSAGLLPVDTRNKCCYLCQLNLDIQHTDVLILSQFVSRYGTMLPLCVTGLCGKQQKIIESLVNQALEAGLMPNLNPTCTYQNPQERPNYKKFNRYFDGKTIQQKIKEYQYY